MPSLKEYKTKIVSLKNTAKMTKTMKLVSASKLRQMHQAQARAKIYSNELTWLIGRLAASLESASHQLLTPKLSVKNILVVVITSDKGLCGGFNNNLNKFVLNWVNTNKGNYAKIEICCLGKRGFMFFRQRLTIQKNYENCTARPNFRQVEDIGDDLIKLFETSAYDEIYLAYNQFINPLSQKPFLDKLLPIESENLLKGGRAFPSDYIFEPDKDELLQLLVPRYFYFRIYYALLENAAGEHGARMTAMDKASQNASDMIDLYTLLRNRARQAAITKELIEIVSGAEALK